MKTDPNADLIGYEFKAHTGKSEKLLTWRIVGSCPNNIGYMQAVRADGTPGDEIIRQTSVIRRARQLASQARFE